MIAVVRNWAVIGRNHFDRGYWLLHLLQLYCILQVLLTTPYTTTPWLYSTHQLSPRSSTMTTELDLTPDLASQQWWDDTWVDVSTFLLPPFTADVLLQVIAGGSISTPTLA